MEHGTAPPRAEGMVIPGLSLVYCGFKIYLGKLQDKDKWKVTLKDALEIEVVRQLREDGMMLESPRPAPIFPHQGPAPTLRISNYNVVIDVSEHEQLTPFYAEITKSSRLFIPGLR